MKYALVDGIKTSIDNVQRGTIGKDLWYNQYDLLACKGHYMSYWKYLNEKLELPEGYENETEWHAIWKSLVYDRYCEVVCGENNEHRADIKTDEYIIELQKSHISYEAAAERINFYYKITGNRVIWVINAYSAWKNIEVHLEGVRLKVKWKYPKKWVVDICGWHNNYFYLDISPTSKNLLKIWKHEGELFGRWEKKHAFYKKYLLKYSETIEDFSTIFQTIDVRDYC